MRLTYLFRVLMFIIDSQSKKLKGFFIYQAAASNVWFDKESCKGVIITSV